MNTTLSAAQHVHDADRAEGRAVCSSSSLTWELANPKPGKTLRLQKHTHNTIIEASFVDVVSLYYFHSISSYAQNNVTL